MADSYESIESTVVRPDGALFPDGTRLFQSTEFGTLVEKVREVLELWEAEPSRAVQTVEVTEERL